MRNFFFVILFMTILISIITVSVQGIEGDSEDYTETNLIYLDNKRTSSVSFGNEFFNVEADFRVKVVNFQNSSDPIKLSTSVRSTSIGSIKDFDMSTTGNVSHTTNTTHRTTNNFEFTLPVGTSIELKYHSHFGCNDCIEGHTWRIKLNGSSDASVSYSFSVTNISSYEKTPVNVYTLILPLLLIPILRRKLQSPQ